MSAPGSVRAGYLFILLAATLWGSLGVASRGVLAAGVSPLELSFWRASIWVAIASALWLHERPSSRTIAAITLTLGGVALVALGGGSGGGVRFATSGVLWGLCAGLAYAVYYLFGKRYFTRYHPSTLFMYALPLGALLLLPAVRFVPKSGATWGWILFVAVVPTWIALQVYGAGLRRLDATRAVTTATIEPVIAALLAWVVWGEALGPLAYAGGALVLAGVLLTARADR